MEVQRLQVNVLVFQSFSNTVYLSAVNNPDVLHDFVISWAISDPDFPSACSASWSASFCRTSQTSVRTYLFLFQLFQLIHDCFPLEALRGSLSLLLFLFQVIPIFGPYGGCRSLELPCDGYLLAWMSDELSPAHNIVCWGSSVWPRSVEEKLCWLENQPDQSNCQGGLYTMMDRWSTVT